MIRFIALTMYLSLKGVKRVYNQLKRQAHKSFRKGDYEEALTIAQAAAATAFQFNWIYADEELESMLQSISNKLILSRTYVPIPNRVVFYDFLAFDNCVLSEQYLTALLSYDVEILFIFENYNAERSTNIQKLLTSPRVTVYKLPQKISNLEKLKALTELITSFCPEKAFLQMHPSSTVAVTLWNAFSQTTRYLINHSDHAFWLGTRCTDYCLEFRDYGATISLEKRGLKKNQILLQPYYPITTCKPFIGFPKEATQDKVIIYTGATYYKMYGEKGIFFTMMKRILDENPKVVILLSGSGDDKPIKKFIKKNSYQKRLFILGLRNDVNYVFQHCDIYLGTYPVTGGLMTQFAAINGKPILAYTDKSIANNYIEGLLYRKKGQLTHTNLDDFYAEAKKLINDREYRVGKGNELRDAIIKPEEFNELLRKLITEHKNYQDVNMDMEINYEKIPRIFLEIENRYLGGYRYFLWAFLRFKIISILPLFSLTSFTSARFIRDLMRQICKKEKNISKIL